MSRRDAHRRAAAPRSPADAARWNGYLKVVRRALIPLLVVISVVGAVMGFHDGLFGVGVGQRLIGLLVLVVAVLQALGLLLLPAWRPRRLWAAPMVLTGSAIGGVLLVAQLLAPEYHPLRSVAWASMLVLPAVFCYTIWRTSPPVVSPRRWATVTSFVTVLVGVLQVVYTTSAAPISDPDTLTLTTQVAAVGAVTSGSERLQEIRSTWEIKNPGGDKLLFLASAYSLVGISPRLVGPPSGSPPGDRAAGVLGATPSPAPTSAYAPETCQESPSTTSNTVDTSVTRYASDSGELVEMGDDLVGGGHWIAAGGEDDGQLISYVPMNRYSSVRFTIQIATARADRVTLGHATIRYQDRRKCVLYQNYPLFQPTDLTRWTQRARFVQIHYYLNPVDEVRGTWLGVIAGSVDPMLHSRADFGDELQRSYGLVVDRASSVAALGSTP